MKIGPWLRILFSLFIVRFAPANTSMPPQRVSEGMR